MNYRFFIIFILISFNNAFSQQKSPILTIDPDGHRAIINKIVFTKDDKYIITCSDDKTIKIWDIFSGQCIHTFRGYIEDGYEGMIYTIALSPDNKYLAAGGWLKNDGIRIYDFSNKNIITILYGNNDVIHDLEFSKDGKYLTSCAHDGKIIVWEIQNNKFQKKIEYTNHSKPIYRITYNNDCSKLGIACYDGYISILDLIKGNLEKKIKISDKEVYGIVFSKKTDDLIVSTFDGLIQLWKLNEFSNYIIDKILSRVNTNYTEQLALSPDGNYLLFGGSYYYFENNRWIYPIFFYNFELNKIEKKFILHNNSVRSIAFSPSGKYIASTGGNDNEIYIYSFDSLNIIRTIKSSGKPVYSVAFGNRNGRIYLGNKNDGKTYLAQTSIEKGFSLLEYSIIKGDFLNYTKIYPKVNDLNFFYEFSLYNRVIMINSNILILPKIYDTIRCYTFTPDGKYAIIGSDFSLVRVDPIKCIINGEFIGHDGKIWAISVSSDSKYLMSGSDDQTIKIWDIEKLKLLVTIFISYDNEWIIWTPDGYYDCSKYGDRFLGFHYNNGVDKEAIYYKANSKEIKDKYYNKEIIRKILLTILGEVKPEEDIDNKIIESKPKEIIPDFLEDF